MEGELDSFPFVLAESLGMTVGMLHETMSNLEYNQWRAFFEYRAAMQDLEVKKADVKRGKR